MSARESGEEAGDQPGESVKSGPSPLDHHIGHREELIPLVREEDTKREESHPEPGDR